MLTTDTPKKIVYGIQGEGRGHTSRSIQIIKQLKNAGHEVLVFGGGDALPLLNYNSIPSIQIPTFRLYTGKKGGINLWKISVKNFSLFWGLIFGLGKKYRQIYQEVLFQNPDFIISDFEPYLLKIANVQKIPVILIDHQHMLLESEIPPMTSIRNRVKLSLFKLFIRILSAKPDRIVTSSFFHFPKLRDSRAVFVGPFLSDAVQNTTPEERNHITVYLKEPFYLQKLLPVIQQLSHIRFEVFSDWSSLKTKPTRCRHIKLIHIHPEKFISSLATSRGLICTAGNQVIGEAIYLGKPILAFPKLNDIEQKINGMALNLSGFGESIEIDRLSPEAVLKFLARGERYKSKLMEMISELGESYNGTPQALQLIDEFAGELRFVDRRYVEIQFGKIKIHYNRLNSRFVFSLVQ
ncbi:MAG: glycosyltransferase family protein [Candidatus Zhuqueibacterota bacterium]